VRYSGQVYKQAYDLCLYIEQLVRSFARYHKPVLSSEQRECIEGYTIGKDLRDTARRVLKLIVRANADLGGSMTWSTAVFARSG